MIAWRDVIKQTELVSIDSTDQLITSNMLKVQTRNVPDSEVTLEDPLFTLYCNTAESLIESLCAVTLRKKTLKLTLSDWPSFGCYGMIRYDNPPIISITNIKYYDKDDVLQTLDSSAYESWLSRTPAMVLIKSDQLPTLSSERTKRVETTFVAGSEGSISPIAQLLVAELVAFWYQERELYGRLPSPNEGGHYRVTQALIDSLSSSLL